MLVKQLLEPLSQKEDVRLPYKCKQCEMLGICRDSDRDWKCRNGCLILKYNADKEKEKL